MHAADDETWKPISTPIYWKTWGAVPRRSGGIFDYSEKRDRLEEVGRELENPDIWSDQEKAQALGRERSRLEAIVTTLEGLKSGLADAAEMLELAIEEQDEEIVESVSYEWAQMQGRVEQLEF